MAWSSSARLAALQPHSAFAITPDAPKQRNPLLAAGPDAVRTTNGSVDFARTIPLSELMQAEAQQHQRQQSRGGNGLASTRGLSSTLNQPLARTQDLAATMGLLPLRVPRGGEYSAELDAVHAARSDRMIRMPRGWSQAEAHTRAARRQEEKEERIQVYNRDGQELITEAAANAAAAAAKRRARTAPTSSSSSSSPSSLDRSAALTSAKLRHFFEDVEEQKVRLAARLAERMAQRHHRDEVAFQAMLARLDDNKGLLDEIDQYLTHEERQTERKKDLLYKQWCEQVYAPIQEAIAEGLAARETSAIEARRVRLFNDFLAVSNSKSRSGGVLSNDAVAAAGHSSVGGGYDPLESRSHTLRVRVGPSGGGPLRDPLKASRQATEDEWALYKVFHPQAQRIEHQTKSTLLPPPIWAKYRIEATPHGRYSLLKGNVQLPVGKRLVEPDAALRDAHNVAEAFDHYHVDTDPATTQAQFFPRGKRVEGYDNLNDKHGYNIVASTEPSIRAAYMTHHTTSKPVASPHQQQQQQQHYQQQPQQPHQPSRPAADQLSSPARPPAQLPSIHATHFSPAPARFVETVMPGEQS